MGLRGPPPTPTAVLAARGSWRAAGREGEPMPPIAVPQCPASASETIRTIWEQVAGMLAAVGVMTQADHVAFTLMMDSLSIYVQAQEKIEKGGLLVQDYGKWVANPAIAVRDRALEQVLKIGKEFGLTPASRTGLRVGTKDTKKVDDKRRYFKLG